MIEIGTTGAPDAVRFLNRRQRRILTFAQQRETFSRSDVELIVGPEGSSTVQEEISEMVEIGLLQPRGGQRNRTYSVVESLPPHAPKPVFRSAAIDEQVRRESLRELDRCLEDLEMLNLIDQRKLPAGLPDRLRVKGVPYHDGMSAPEAIEAVFAAQAKYMLSLEEEDIEL